MGKQTPSRAEVILHPQRLAIVRALGAAPATAQELLAALPELSQSSLYRHLALLHERGILQVVAERQLRGAVERTYGLARTAIVAADEVAESSDDEHFRYFGAFVGSLMGEYGAYLDRGDVDLERDGVGYRLHVVHASDDELVAMVGELREVIARYEAAPATPGRRPRTVATITLPMAQPHHEEPHDDHDR
jgi:DNA-binding transcriptional ArsR family regulator